MPWWAYLLLGGKPLILALFMLTWRKDRENPSPWNAGPARPRHCD